MLCKKSTYISKYSNMEGVSVVFGKPCNVRLLIYFSPRFSLVHYTVSNAYFVLGYDFIIKANSLSMGISFAPTFFKVADSP